MPNGHWSDCSLHRTPAYWPKACDCGGFEEGKNFSRLKRYAQLWEMRWVHIVEKRRLPFRARLRSADP